MPVIRIVIVGSRSAGVDTSRLTQQLADGLGELLNSEPGGTWVSLEYLDRDAYAENGVTLADEVQPTFVRILQHKMPAADELAGEVPALTRFVSNTLQRPYENTHLIFELDGLNCLLL